MAAALRMHQRGSGHLPLAKSTEGRDVTDPDDDHSRSGDGKGASLALWTAVGVALGSSLGAAFDNIGIGVGMGIAIGVAIGVVSGNRKSK